jgi:uncharacterized protein (DUF305 family)
MRISPILFLLAAAGVSACAPRGGAAPSPAPLTPPAQVLADSLRLPYTKADVTFMTEMIGHHAQAIMISRWAPTHGADSSLRILAARIINAQMDDINLMRQWLRDRGKPLPSVTPDGVYTPAPADPNDEHAGHDMGDHSAMAGMLTPAQLAELDSKRGEEFAILFLQRMINHHRGAVTMVQTLIRDRGAIDETVFRFAADVEVDQSTEIRRMLQMLLERGGTPPE